MLGLFVLLLIFHIIKAPITKLVLYGASSTEVMSLIHKTYKCKCLYFEIYICIYLLDNAPYTVRKNP